jgi:hypothetical protein
MLMLQFASNLRMALENISKYGVLVNPITWFAPFFTDPHGIPLLAVWVNLLASYFFAMWIERVRGPHT